MNNHELNNKQLQHLLLLEEYMLQDAFRTNTDSNTGNVTNNIDRLRANVSALQMLIPQSFLS